MVQGVQSFVLQNVRENTENNSFGLSNLKKKNTFFYEKTDTYHEIPITLYVGTL